MTSAETQPSGEMSKGFGGEFKEDPEKMESDVAHIKKWLKQQPHLPDDWDTNIIKSFIRGCNFSLERTKHKLDMHFTMRTACPEFYANRNIDSPEHCRLSNKMLGSIMPVRNSNGYNVIICTVIEDILPSEIFESLKILIQYGDIRLKEENANMTGDIYIVDSSMVKPYHMINLSMTTAKKFAVCIQEAYPFRVKEVHFINATPLISTIINLLKPMAKKKIVNRVFIHSNVETLYERVPKHILPEELGGTGGSLTKLNEIRKEILSKHKEWFQAEESVKANEALRPGKSTNYDELFGIDGSFRQLSID